MDNQLDDYYKNGLLIETFQAERNILIWKHVADEIDFLESQNNETQKLYSFIQQSAQTNFILSIGKLYDTPNNKYPTRCILSFIKLLESLSSNAVQIIETTTTKRVLVQFNCPTELIESIDSSDYGLFPRILSKYCLEKYKDINLQKSVDVLKSMRDKAVAHNEAIGDLLFPFEDAERLLGFASEIISIFGMAYHSTIWQRADFSFIKRNAEKDAFFIKACIDNLKRLNYV